MTVRSRKACGFCIEFFSKIFWLGPMMVWWMVMMISIRQYISIKSCLAFIILLILFSSYSSNYHRAVLLLLLLLLQLIVVVFVVSPLLSFDPCIKSYEYQSWYFITLLLSFLWSNIVLLKVWAQTDMCHFCGHSLVIGKKTAVLCAVTRSDWTKISQRTELLYTLAQDD